MLNRKDWEFSSILWSIKLFNRNQGINQNGYKIRSFLRILFIFTNNLNLLRTQNFWVRNDNLSNLDVWQTELHALPIQFCNRSTSQHRNTQGYGTISDRGNYTQTSLKHFKLWVNMKLFWIEINKFCPKSTSALTFHLLQMISYSVEGYPHVGDI